MSSPQRYINRVIAFLVLALGVLGVLHEVVLQAFLHNPLLNALILTVMIIGIVYNFRRMFRLKPELRWIEAARSGSPGLSTQDAPVLLAPVAQALGQHRDRRGRSLLSAVSVRHLLDGLGSRLDESRDIARYLTGLLIFLGLLGTFYGLLLTMDSIGSVIGGLSLGSQDMNAIFDDLKSGLAEPLRGMGTSFSASLFGLAGSLVLGFLDLQATQAQNAFYNDSEEWLTEQMQLTAVPVDSGGRFADLPVGTPIPAYVQALLQQTAENLDALQNNFLRSEENRGQIVATLGALNDRLGVLNDHLTGQQRLVARVSETQEALLQALARLAGNAGGAAALDETSRAHLRNLDLHLSRLVEDLHRGREEMTRELKSEIKLVARTIAVAAGEPPGLGT